MQQTHTMKKKKTVATESMTSLWNFIFDLIKRINCLNIKILADEKNTIFHIWSSKQIQIKTTVKKNL